jgi:hypothetical protein
LAPSSSRSLIRQWFHVDTAVIPPLRGRVLKYQVGSGQWNKKPTFNSRKVETPEILPTKKSRCSDLVTVVRSYHSNYHEPDDPLLTRKTASHILKTLENSDGDIERAEGIIGLKDDDFVTTDFVMTDFVMTDCCDDCVVQCHQWG